MDVGGAADMDVRGSAGMDVRALAVPGAWVFTPRRHTDQRGSFLEWYRADVVEAAVGYPLTLAQANHSVSRRGVLRGIHYADVPPGQAKYVYCPRGAVLDVVVDLRLGSPTYGETAAVRLDDSDRRAVYLGEGLGHAFLALVESSVSYLCSTLYRPGAERAVHPLDPDLQIAWPTEVGPLLLSSRDNAAPTLAEAAGMGALPAYADCRRRYERLRTGDRRGA